MEKPLYDLSRGSLIRQVYEDEPKISSIREPISKLMGKIGGAELVSEQWMKIGDMYQITYFVSPEGVCLHFEAEARVRIRGFAPDADTLHRVTERMQKVLGCPNF